MRWYDKILGREEWFSLRARMSIWCSDKKDERSVDLMKLKPLQFQCRILRFEKLWFILVIIIQSISLWSKRYFAFSDSSILSKFRCLIFIFLDNIAPFRNMNFLDNWFFVVISRLATSNLKKRVKASIKSIIIDLSTKLPLTFKRSFWGIRWDWCNTERSGSVLIR